VTSLLDVEICNTSGEGFGRRSVGVEAGVGKIWDPELMHKGSHQKINAEKVQKKLSH